MKFKLVENIHGGHENVSSNDILNETVEQNLKNNILAQVKKYYPYITIDKEGYVLHHIDGAKEGDPTYKNANNVVLIPKIFSATTSGNDLHHLIHWLKLHKDEVNQPFCFGVDHFNKKVKPRIKQYSIMDLINLL